MAECQQATGGSLPAWAINYAFSGPLRPHEQTPKRSVPSSIVKPDYADHPDGYSLSEDQGRGRPCKVYKGEELERVRHACRMGREVLDEAGKALRVGVTCDEIDRVVHEASIERDCYPSPLNYFNFPKVNIWMGRRLIGDWGEVAQSVVDCYARRPPFNLPLSATLASLTSASLSLSLS